MYFYRIQNEQGVGPYRGMSEDEIKKWGTNFHSVENGRPNMYADGLLATHHSVFKFAFVSLRQLQSWFRPEELRRLDRMGYKPCRVKGKVVKETKYQVLYKPTT